MSYILFQIALDDLSEIEKLDKIRKERGYTYEDAITISRKLLPNYEEKVMYLNM